MMTISSSSSKAASCRGPSIVCRCSISRTSCLAIALSVRKRRAKLSFLPFFKTPYYKKTYKFKKMHTKINHYTKACISHYRNPQLQKSTLQEKKKPTNANDTFPTIPTPKGTTKNSRKIPSQRTRMSTVR